MAIAGLRESSHKRPSTASQKRTAIAGRHTRPSTAGLREARHKRIAIAGASEPNQTVNCENDHLRDASGITSRIDVERAAERHEDRSHAERRNEVLTASVRLKRSHVGARVWSADGRRKDADKGGWGTNREKEFGPTRRQRTRLKDPERSLLINAVVLR